jgi:hypothetical protein
MTGNGLIAGSAAIANNQSHAAVWFVGFHLDLATPGLGGANSFADAVNDKGQVVGAAQTTVAHGENFCGFKCEWVCENVHPVSAFRVPKRRGEATADARRPERHCQLDQQPQRGGGMGGNHQQGPESRLRSVAVPASPVGNHQHHVVAARGATSWHCA